MIYARFTVNLNIILFILFFSFGCATVNHQEIEPPTQKQLASIKTDAEAGDTNSVFILGLLYVSGTSIEKNTVLGQKYLVRAAEAGHSGAQHSLGYMYHEGDGVQKDFAIAKQWYEKAVAQGNPNSMYNLGVMYDYGLGVEKDWSRAYDLYHEAAQRCHESAETALRSIGSRHNLKVHNDSGFFSSGYSSNVLTRTADLFVFGYGGEDRQTLCGQN